MLAGGGHLGRYMLYISGNSQAVKKEVQTLLN